MQDGDEEGLGRVEGGEEVSQQERRSRQEHQARGPGDALKEEQRQGAHRPRPGDAGGSRTRSTSYFIFTQFCSPRSVLVLFMNLISQALRARPQLAQMRFYCAFTVKLKNILKESRGRESFSKGPAIKHIYLSTTILELRLKKKLIKTTINEAFPLHFPDNRHVFCSKISL